MNHTGHHPANNPKTEVVAIIPSRYDSIRLPGKALVKIAGKPMICWVVEHALAARNVSRVIVATEDLRIMEAVNLAGHEAVMTRRDHRSGTDRIAEVAASLKDAQIIVNVQGDEPLISPQTIERAVDEMKAAEGKRQSEKGNEEQRGRGDEETGGGGEREREQDGEKGKGEGETVTGIVTTWEPMESAQDVLNPDVVKVVVGQEDQAIYFSRSPVPYLRDAVREHGSLKTALRTEPRLLSEFRKHTGLYVYRRDVLLQFTNWPQTELERLESLEQLRALEHGVRIKAIKASTSSIGVDTVKDLERVRKIVSSSEFRVQSCSFKFQV